MSQLLLTLTGARRRGGSILAPVLGADLYADDFELPAGHTPTGGGSFTGRAGWAVTGAGGAAEMRVDDGYSHNTVLNATLKTCLLGAAVLPPDMRCSFGYNTTNTNLYGDVGAWQFGHQTFLVWYYDSSNYIELVLTPSSNRLTINMVVGGVTTAVNISGATTFKAHGELYVEIKSGVLYLRLDGIWFWVNSGDYTYPFWGYKNLNTLQTDVTKRSGFAGFTCKTARWAACEGIAASPLYVSLTHVPPFIARGSKTSTQGTVPFSGIYAIKTPVSGLYRVRGYPTGATVQDWRTMTGFTASAGSWSGTGAIPVGGPYTLDVGYTDTLGESWYTTSRDVCCGALVAYYGQSNSVGRNTLRGAYTTESVAADRAAIAVGGVSGIPNGNWNTAEAKYGSGLYQKSSAYPLAKNLAALLGVPVGVGVSGHSGTGVVYLATTGFNLQNGTNGGFGYFAPLWSSQGAAAVEAVIWDQGEADADSGTSPTSYATQFLTQLLPALRTATGNPTLPVLISPIGRYGDTIPPNNTLPAATNDAYREVLRQQYLLCLAGDANVFWGGTHLGGVHPVGNAFHYDGVSYDDFARREAWSVAKNVYGVNTHDGRGPVVTSASRSGAVVTLTLDLNGATGLTDLVTADTGVTLTQPAGALYGYQVSADNFATLLTISSIVRSGTSLVITLSGDPGGPVKVRSFYGWSYEDKYMFWGTYSDTGNIPVWPIITPLLTAT